MARRQERRKDKKKKLFSGNFDGSRVKVFIERNRNSSGLTFTWNFFRESFFRLCSFAGFLGQSTKEFRAAMHKKWLQKASSWSKFGEATDQLNSYVSLGRVDPCSSSAPLSCPRTCSHLALDWLFGSLISNSSLSDKNVLYLHSLLLMESSVCAEVIILQVSQDICLKWPLAIVSCKDTELKMIPAHVNRKIPLLLTKLLTIVIHTVRIQQQYCVQSLLRKR